MREAEFSKKYFKTEMYPNAVINVNKIKLFHFRWMNQNCSKKKKHSLAMFAVSIPYLRTLLKCMRSVGF